MGAVQRALDTRASVVVSDAQRDPFLGERPSVVEMGLGVVACVPLRQDDRILGLIYVDSPRARVAFTELDIEILEALADHTATVIADLQREHRISDPAARARSTTGPIDEPGSCPSRSRWSRGATARVPAAGVAAPARLGRALIVLSRRCSACGR